MGKKIAILQSNYIPWKGYFDLIAAVDEFVLYDDMQYTRRDWRNRNKIKTADGLLWLTVPVKVKGKYEQSIRETEIDGTAWAKSHLKSLQHAYKKSSHFDEIMALIEPIYAQPFSHLSSLNHAFITAICQHLGIQTTITNSWDYTLVDGKSERLAGIAAQAGATTYISGPAAKDYLDARAFEKRGIHVEWFEYEGYPHYKQLTEPFEHGVSILDLLFNCGKASPQFMRFA